MLDLSDTIVPKSDQLNSDDLRSGPRTFTIAEVRKTNSDEQPVSIVLAEFPRGRPWKPSKSMRRVMVEVWGRDASAYTGKRLTLYREETIKYGGQEVGGIRIQAMTGLKKPKPMALHVARGKYESIIVQPLADDAPVSPAVSPELLAELTAMFVRKGVPEEKWLPGVNKVTGGSATALEVITEAEARQVMDVLRGRPDVEPVEDPPTDHQGEPYLPDGGDQ